MSGPPPVVAVVGPTATGKTALAVALAGIPVRCFLKLAQERFRAAGEVGPAAAIDIWSAVAGLAFGVGLALLGMGAEAPLAGMLLAPLVALPFVLPAELREAKRGRLDRQRLKAYAVYGYPIAVGLGLTVVLASTTPIFAFLIALIGCLEGFKVSGSAQSVGEHTTSAVVQSIFVVILLDALAALFLMEMGW